MTSSKSGGLKAIILAAGKETATTGAEQIVLQPIGDRKVID